MRQTELREVVRNAKSALRDHYNRFRQSGMRVTIGQDEAVISKLLEDLGKDVQFKAWFDAHVGRAPDPFDDPTFIDIEGAFELFFDRGGAGGRPRPRDVNLNDPVLIGGLLTALNAEKPPPKAAGL